MIIPKTLIVGYNERANSLTKRLGFVTASYHGKIKFENSFNKWINKDIDTDIISNEPKDGFIINFADPCHYGEREAFVRIWHPDGFEFEIKLNNFFEMMLNNSVDRGGVLIGKFSLGWDNSSSKKIRMFDANTLQYKIGKLLINSKSYTFNKLELEHKKDSKLNEPIKRYFYCGDQNKTISYLNGENIYEVFSTVSTLYKFMSDIYEINEDTYNDINNILC